MAVGRAVLLYGLAQVKQSSYEGSGKVMARASSGYQQNAKPRLKCRHEAIRVANCSQCAEEE